MGILRFLGNLAWMLLGGIVISAVWILAGIILCVTVIGIPFGIQCFKLATLSLMPFGMTVVPD
jgi:uncharacterized membrane protein YccF (DUF307 family)